jgi:nitronate monooxygenase
MPGFDIMETFNLAAPIIQAPMAGVSTPELAAAVSNAGCIGSIAIGASTLTQAQQLIEETRSRTSRPFNVNVFCHQPAQRDAVREAAWLDHLAPLFREFDAPVPTTLNEIYKSFLDGDEAFCLLLALKPPIVSFHFGIPPADWITAFREAGIKTMATATHLHEAKQIESAGIDMIVAQGIEAGGHRGIFDPTQHDAELNIAVLISLLVERVNIPVIAAGGIILGSMIKAALDLGAAAAQLGTAFILCPESAANASYRAALKSERARNTRMTSAISGRPARGLVNRLIEHGSTPGSPPPAAYPLAYDAAKTLNAVASAHGNHDFAAQWAGVAAPLARELPAAKLIEELIKEMQTSGHLPSN